MQVGQHQTTPTAGLRAEINSSSQSLNFFSPADSRNKCNKVWSKLDDSRLLDSVPKLDQKWGLICAGFPGKTAADCLERYNFLTFSGSFGVSETAPASTELLVDFTRNAKSVKKKTANVHSKSKNSVEPARKLLKTKSQTPPSEVAKVPEGPFIFGSDFPATDFNQFDFTSLLSSEINYDENNREFSTNFNLFSDPSPPSELPNLENISSGFPQMTDFLPSSTFGNDLMSTDSIFNTTDLTYSSNPLFDFNLNQNVNDLKETSYSTQLPEILRTPTVHANSKPERKNSVQSLMDILNTPVRNNDDLENIMKFSSLDSQLFQSPSPAYGFPSHVGDILLGGGGTPTNVDLHAKKPIKSKEIIVKREQLIIPKAELDCLFIEHLNTASKEEVMMLMPLAKKSLKCAAGARGKITTEQVDRLQIQLKNSQQLAMQSFLTSREVFGDLDTETEFWKTQMETMEKIRNIGNTDLSQSVSESQRVSSIIINHDSEASKTFKRRYTTAVKPQRQSKKATLQPPKPFKLPKSFSELQKMFDDKFDKDLIPSIVKVARGPAYFSPEEDILLLRGLRLYGFNQFESIRAHFLPTKLAPQISRRVKTLSARGRPTNDLKAFCLNPFKPMTLLECDLMRSGINALGVNFRPLAVRIFNHQPRQLLKAAWTHMLKLGEVGCSWHPQSSSVSELNPNSLETSSKSKANGEKSTSFLSKSNTAPPKLHTKQKTMQSNRVESFTAHEKPEIANHLVRLPKKQDERVNNSSRVYFDSDFEDFLAQDVPVAASQEKPHKSDRFLLQPTTLQRPNATVSASSSPMKSPSDRAKRNLSVDENSVETIRRLGVKQKSTISSFSSRLKALHAADESDALTEDNDTKEISRSNIRSSKKLAFEAAQRKIRQSRGIPQRPKQAEVQAVKNTTTLSPRRQLRPHNTDQNQIITFDQVPSVSKIIHQVPKLGTGKGAAKRKILPNNNPLRSISSNNIGPNNSSVQSTDNRDFQKNNLLNQIETSAPSTLNASESRPQFLLPVQPNKLVFSSPTPMYPVETNNTPPPTVLRPNRFPPATPIQPQINPESLDICTRLSNALALLGNASAGPECRDAANTLLANTNAFIRNIEVAASALAQANSIATMTFPDGGLVTGGDENLPPENRGGQGKRKRVSDVQKTPTKQKKETRI